MRAVVVYESVYGNTRAIAEAIAAGLGSTARTVAVQDIADLPGDVDLLVVGGPTHIHGMATTRSLTTAAAATVGERPAEARNSEEDLEDVHHPALREWLHSLGPAAGRVAAAFDTRMDKPSLLTGSAARGIARRLRHHGLDVVDVESFLVAGSEGPLEAGELDRARAWGRQLAAGLTRTVPSH